MPVQSVETIHVPGRSIVAGEQLADNDPIVKGREHLFTKVEEDKPKPRKATARKATASKAES